jgi:hypothetical protein
VPDTELALQARDLPQALRGQGSWRSCVRWSRPRYPRRGRQWAVRSAAYEAAEPRTPVMTC